MLKELYVFSNDPVPPVNEFKEGLESEYVNLSTYLNPTIAVAPSYEGTPEHNVKEIDRLKRDLVNDYQFVHVYKHKATEYVENAIGSINEVHIYRYSHKEFN